ncbi:MAG: hypothetical protein PHU04_04990 [Candidatus Peribacteraceae bacterium]|nr:hypothetical protein [Candidatus Peribacteraceae bacterium]
MGDLFHGPGFPEAQPERAETPDNVVDGASRRRERASVSEDRARQVHEEHVAQEMDDWSDRFRQFDLDRYLALIREVKGKRGNIRAAGHLTRRELAEIPASNFTIEPGAESELEQMRDLARSVGIPDIDAFRTRYSRESKSMYWEVRDGSGGYAALNGLGSLEPIARVAMEQRKWEAKKQALAALVGGEPESEPEMVAMAREPQEAEAKVTVPESSFIEDVTLSAGSRANSLAITLPSGRVIVRPANQQYYSTQRYGRLEQARSASANTAEDASLEASGIRIERGRGVVHVYVDRKKIPAGKKVVVDGQEIRSVTPVEERRMRAGVQRPGVQKEWQRYVPGYQVVDIPAVEEEASAAEDIPVTASTPASQRATATTAASVADAPPPAPARTRGGAAIDGDTTISSSDAGERAEGTAAAPASTPSSRAVAPRPEAAPAAPTPEAPPPDVWSAERVPKEHPLRIISSPDAGRTIHVALRKSAVAGRVGSRNNETIAKMHAEKYVRKQKGIGSTARVETTTGFAERHTSAAPQQVSRLRSVREVAIPVEGSFILYEFETRSGEALPPAERPVEESVAPIDTHRAAPMPEVPAGEPPAAKPETEKFTEEEKRMIADVVGKIRAALAGQNLHVSETRGVILIKREEDLTELGGLGMLVSLGKDAGKWNIGFVSLVGADVPGKVERKRKFDGKPVTADASDLIRELAQIAKEFLRGKRRSPQPSEEEAREMTDPSVRVFLGKIEHLRAKEPGLVETIERNLRAGNLVGAVERMLQRENPEFLIYELTKAYEFSEERLQELYSGLSDDAVRYKLFNYVSREDSVAFFRRHPECIVPMLEQAKVQEHVGYARMVMRAELLKEERPAECNAYLNWVLEHDRGPDRIYTLLSIIPIRRELGRDVQPLLDEAYAFAQDHHDTSLLLRTITVHPEDQQQKALSQAIERAETAKDRRRLIAIADHADLPRASQTFAQQAIDRLNTEEFHKEWREKFGVRITDGVMTIDKPSAKLSSPLFPEGIREIRGNLYVYNFMSFSFPETLKKVDGSIYIAQGRGGGYRPKPGFSFPRGLEITGDVFIDHKPEGMTMGEVDNAYYFESLNQALQQVTVDGKVVVYPPRYGRYFEGAVETSNTSPLPSWGR